MNNAKFTAILCAVCIFCLSPSANAAIPIPDIATMLKNLNNTMPALMRLIMAMAYVMGLFFITKGLGYLKHVGEMRTAMTREHELKTPLIFLLVGALLIYIPSSIKAGLATFWIDPNPLAYQHINDTESSDIYDVIFSIMKLIGTIAFIRGLVLLTHLTGNAQPGTFGKAMAHIIGGLFCINLYQFIQAILATLGITI